MRNTASRTYASPIVRKAQPFHWPLGSPNNLRPVINHQTPPNPTTVYPPLSPRLASLPPRENEREGQAGIEGDDRPPADRALGDADTKESGRQHTNQSKQSAQEYIAEAQRHPKEHLTTGYEEPGRSQAKNQPQRPSQQLQRHPP